MLDVGTVAQALLRQRPRLRATLGSMLGLEAEQLIGFAGFVAALHDSGKYARAFQAKFTLPRLPADQGLCEAQLQNRHDADGMALWQYWLRDSALVDRIWPGMHPGTLHALVGASVCHHGEPAEPSIVNPANQFGAGLDAVTVCREVFLDLLLPSPVNAPALRKREAKQASHLLAGLVTVADWIGSSQAWFPYAMPHDDVAAYLENAREQALRAVVEAGYAPATVAQGQGFSTLIGKESSPTPLQQWALDVSLPDGPALFILEDVTGAGKTEAAHLLVHRLMEAERASGAFWAMPTQATANAMYGRQANLLASLFSVEGPRPSLALAHGQAKLHPAFRASARDWGQDEVKQGESPANLSASAACAAFLADDRRLALLADIGAGTIDQAVLAVLPSRFSPVRLLGLSEKVIVIDEAHAHDAYVTEEMLTLLRFHRGMGGSAVILSATLTNAQREALSRCWQGTAVFAAPKGWTPDETRYPLATAVGPDVMVSNTIAPASWSRRRTSVTLVETPEAVLDGLTATLAAGGCAAWVRNTVGDVHEAAAMARNLGLEPIIFHSRFAQCDRQTIEAQIMARFGPGSTLAERAGQLVIATQVIEQSLDIDFDQLASDLAPIDLLLQRAGRMRRHSGRERLAGLGDAMLVLTPQPVEDAGAYWLKTPLPGTAAVYRDHGVLWRTAREIMARGTLAVPDDVRELVEAVHAGSACPDALLSSSDAAYGKDRVDSALAGHQLLKFDDGYTPGNKWESDLVIATRNIEASVTIRLARRDPGGQIVPWAAGKDGDWPEWQAWALSEVRLSGSLAKVGLRSPTEFADEITPIVARWGRFERELPLCVLRPTDEGWEGRISTFKGDLVHVFYNQDIGLCILKG
jgi:CRISPR-associated endonuclease/helicase Cas3